MLQFLSFKKPIIPANFLTRHYHPPPTTESLFISLYKSNPKPTLNHTKQIHVLLLTADLSHKNGLFTTLLENLIAVGDLHYARQLFDDMHKPRPFLWNTLFRAYYKNNLPSRALSLYSQMHSLSIRPDEFTFPFVLKSCTALLDTQLGVAVHGLIVKSLMGDNAIVNTELMVMYAKFGDSESADYVFHCSNVDGRRDLVLWNARISAYAQNGNAGKALSLFRTMRSFGLRPDAITVVSALSACGHLGCLELGREIHHRMNEKVINVYVENALLDMYSKCGSMDEASELFSQMGHRRNVISWSTMIGGYAINGDCDKALALFSQMQDERVKANEVTLLSVLTACSHGGLVSRGKEYFSTIVNPTLEQYATMVDLLGRSGHLDEAFRFIESMPIEPDAAVWGALLAACTVHRNSKFGQIAAGKLFKLAPYTPSYQVLLSNMYAISGRWDDVKKVREHMRGNNLKKVAAFSSVELNGEVHVFFEGSHWWCREVYLKLDEINYIIKEMGYVPETGVVLHDVEVEEKEYTLKIHSEKLALAFILVCSRKRGVEVPLRIMKNLRVCGDCHTFFKYVSKAIGREIIMRDKSRFHHFRDGRCSCKDFW